MAEKVTLVFTDISNNTNKFYDATLNDDGTVYVEWGRIRDGVRPKGQSKTYPGGRTKFEQLIRSKEKKGYKQVETLAATASSAKASQNFALDAVAMDQIVGTDKAPIGDLVKFLVKQNLHSVISSTSLKFDEASGLFRTPVGIVTAASLDEAAKLLDDINDMVSSGKYKTDTINDYLTLIPRDLGVRKMSPDEIFGSGADISQERDLIDNLRTSLDMALKAPADDDDDKTPDTPKVFDLTLGMASAADKKKISSWFDRTNKSMHRRTHMSVDEVFTVNRGDSLYDPSIGNVEQVWHGTGVGNVLSIMRSGLRCAPPSSAKIAGKMWGHGVYGAKDSSKSLNYSSSFWGGTQSDCGWLFVCDFAMGKVNEPDGRGGRSYPGKGYDSVWAKASKTSLVNDELIVYTDSQVKITHLVRTTPF